MQISSRFTIAVHMLCYIALFQDKEKVTSDIMAGSINANPVVVRRLLSQLKQRGMVTVNRGSGGAFLAMKPEDIDFLQIYRTVETVKRKVSSISTKTRIPTVWWDGGFIRRSTRN